jgi:hypothetical protein
MVSFQVHRVLLYSIDGTFRPPSSKTGAFSKSNWGDYQTASQRGVVKTVKRASVFLKKIRRLQDQQWTGLYKAALENNEDTKRVESVEGDDESDASGDDDALLDPLYDEIPEPAGRAD